MYERIQEKFIDELDMIFWACFGTIIFSWIWIKCNFVVIYSCKGNEAAHRKDRDRARKHNDIAAGANQQSP